MNMCKCHARLPGAVLLLVFGFFGAYSEGISRDSNYITCTTVEEVEDGGRSEKISKRTFVEHGYNLNAKLRNP